MDARILLMAALFLAGCTGPSGDGPSDPSNEPAGDSGVGSSTGDGSETPDGLAYAASFRLNGCHGLLTTSTWPAHVGPGQAPPGWEYGPEDMASGQLGSGVTIEILSCSRVSWGPFERPLTILRELHSNFRAPEACDLDGQQLVILNSLWANDTEFVDYLVTNYGIPARYGTFTEESDEGSLPKTATWRWHGEGTEPSELTVHHGTSATFETVLQERMFWPNGKGISYADHNGTVLARSDSEYLYTTYRPVTGTLNEPMLHASSGTTSYVAEVGALAATYDSIGEIKEFSDLACAKPLQPA